MREIVLDTETTGLDPAAGHRIVEIACIELVNRVPTGKRWQQYVNPERDMPEEAFRVHGLSAEFLAAHPVFADIAEAFVEFVADSPLVIHNAEFDLKFLNAELAILGRPPLDGREIIDTVKIARRKFPGAPASLDALCRRFAIDNSARDLHGALLDTELLAEVYLELMGGRQPALALVDSGQTSADSVRTGSRTVRLPRPHDATPQEIAAHEAFIEAIKDPIWKR